MTARKMFHDEMADLHVKKIMIPEIMFKPSIIGIKGSNIVQATHEAIMACEEDKREILWRHVILSGGNTMFPGFEERFNTEMQKLRRNFSLVHVEDRIRDIVKGACIVASLSNFEQQVKNAKNL